MITEDYVSFETAKLLKDKGFNEPCRLYYDKYHGYVPIFVEDSELTEYGYKELARNDQNSISDFIASAPSLYSAMKWLRETHNIHPNIVVEVYGPCATYMIDRIFDGNEEKWVDFKSDENPSNLYSKREEACEAAIKYCLENLI